MHDYRAYVFGVDGHRFIRVQDFLSEYAEDTAALKAAQQFTDKSDVEVWESGRLVARLEFVAPKSASAELAPPLVAEAPSTSGKEPGKQISLSKVSDMALDVSTESDRGRS
jgi:hypothetical protein